MTALVAVVAHPSTKEPVWVAFATMTIGIQSSAQQKLSNVNRDNSVTQDGMSAVHVTPILYQVIVAFVLKASVA